MYLGRELHPHDSWAEDFAAGASSHERMLADPSPPCGEGDCSEDEHALPAATCLSPGSTTTLRKGRRLELFSQIRQVDAGLAGYQMVDHDTGMGKQTLTCVLPQPESRVAAGGRAPSTDALDAISSRTGSTAHRVRLAVAALIRCRRR
jgi:hypothetical protein